MCCMVETDKILTYGEQSGHVALYVWTNVTCKTGTVVHVMYNEDQLNVACNAFE